MSTIYEFSVKKVNGEIQSMEDYKGKPLIIVNTASKCGFTSQFKELQELYEEYKDQGLVVLGFPSDNFNNQEFDNIEKTMEFCEINYGVTFPMFAKVDVKGISGSTIYISYFSKERVAYRRNQMELYKVSY